jgi:hypothetical protein
MPARTVLDGMLDASVRRASDTRSARDGDAAAEPLEFAVLVKAA